MSLDSPIFDLVALFLKRIYRKKHFIKIKNLLPILPHKTNKTLHNCNSIPLDFFLTKHKFQFALQLPFALRYTKSNFLYAISLCSPRLYCIQNSPEVRFFPRGRCTRAQSNKRYSVISCTLQLNRARRRNEERKPVIPRRTKMRKRVSFPQKRENVPWNLKLDFAKVCSTIHEEQRERCIDRCISVTDASKERTVLIRLFFKYIFLLLSIYWVHFDL